MAQPYRTTCTVVVDGTPCGKPRDPKSNWPKCAECSEAYRRAINYKVLIKPKVRKVKPPEPAKSPVVRWTYEVRDPFVWDDLDARIEMHKNERL